MERELVNRCDRWLHISISQKSPQPREPSLSFMPVVFLNASFLISRRRPSFPAQTVLLTLVLDFKVSLDVTQLKEHFGLNKWLPWLLCWSRVPLFTHNTLMKNPAQGPVKVSWQIRLPSPMKLIKKTCVKKGGKGVTEDSVWFEARQQKRINPAHLICTKMALPG